MLSSHIWTTSRLLVSVGGWFAISFLVSLSSCYAQKDSTVFDYSTYGLATDSANVIQNASHLDGFYEQLLHLKQSADTVVSIAHIGDSHIQADYLTHAIRKNFQEQFGNAGRGLIVPARVAGSNDAFNVVSRSPQVWKAKRCVHPDQPLPIGIGGITISTDQPDASVEVYMKDLWLDHSFNTVSLFFQKDITSFHFAVKDTAGQTLGFIGPFTDEAHANYSRVILSHSVSSITMQAMKSTEEQLQATIFGLSLENGKPGVLYHAIGVNGAKYAHYNAAMFFTRQTAALRPGLFVISLGTNESLDYPYLDKTFPQQIDNLVTALRKYNPEARFILVTPQDVFRKKSKPNPGTMAIRNLILNYAVENGLAFWDMFQVCGGENSAAAWRNAGLLRSDGVHLTRLGYEYQGNLLYQAIFKGYQNYVSTRHP